jgi:hypothetical protein
MERAAAAALLLVLALGAPPLAAAQWRGPWAPTGAAQAEREGVAPGRRGG